MFVITMYFEGLKEDWFCQLGHPRKIKNLLTYFYLQYVFFFFFLFFYLGGGGFLYAKCNYRVIFAFS